MNVYWKSLRLFLVLIVGVFFLVGCKPDKGDKNTNSPSHNEPSNGSNGSGNEENNNNQNSDGSSQDEENDNSVVSNDREKTEYHDVYAERKLVIDIDVPFEIGYFHILKNFKHSKNNNNINDERKKITYLPYIGYIGEDELKVEFYEKNNHDNKVTRIYHIKIKKPILEENRDFTISYACESISKHFSTQNLTFDIDIIDKDLSLIDKVFNNQKYYSSYLPRTIIPTYSKTAIDNASSSRIYKERGEVAKRHHSIFNNHLDGLMRITCNYDNGFFNLIYPIKNKEWYADKPGMGLPTEYEFGRNDLYFYVSSLSELHSRIYLKEYKNGTNMDNSILHANDFMNKIFPNSHYTAELLGNYSHDTGWLDLVPNQYSNYRDMYNHENELYYKRLKLLAEEVSNGNIIELTKKIADNYESYYLSGNKKCLNITICGTLFPEFTTVINPNYQFKEGVTEWSTREEVDSSLGSGGIDLLPSTEAVVIDLTINRPNGSNDDSSDLAVYQTEILNGNINDYFLSFDLSEVYGGTYKSMYGLTSSGYAGVYLFLKDKNNKILGYLTWTDHLNPRSKHS